MIMFCKSCYMFYHVYVGDLHRWGPLANVTNAEILFTLNVLTHQEGREYGNHNLRTAVMLRTAHIGLVVSENNFKDLN